MKFDWKKALHIGATIVGAVVPGVNAVEVIAGQIGGLHGKDKQDAVVELVKAALSSAESLTSKDLANDSDVEHATRSVIDAIVSLHQVVAKKTAV